MTVWNRTFTDKLRENRGHLWGNWSLDSAIKPGAIGYVDEASGEFRPIGSALSKIKLTETAPQHFWKMTSDGVKTHEATLSTSGDMKAAKAEFEIKWEFSKKHSYISRFALSKEVYISNLLELVRNNWKKIHQQALNANFADNNGNIFQGFGIISGVIYARSGLNAVSESEHKGLTLSISGKTDEIKGMIGEASAMAKYSSVNASEELLCHLWPNRSNRTAPGDVPVAFTFLSFDNQKIIPIWTKKISELCLTLKNKGGYIVKADLTYNDENGNLRKQSRTVPGGASRNFSLPLGATQLDLKLDFLATNQDKAIGWGSPLGEWINGKRTIELGGFWGGNTTMKDY